MGRVLLPLVEEVCLYREFLRVLPRVLAWFAANSCVFLPWALALFPAHVFLSVSRVAGAYICVYMAQTPRAVLLAYMYLYCLSVASLAQADAIN